MSTQLQTYYKRAYLIFWGSVFKLKSDSHLQKKKFIYLKAF